MDFVLGVDIMPFSVVRDALPGVLQELFGLWPGVRRRVGHKREQRSEARHPLDQSLAQRLLGNAHSQGKHIIFLQILYISPA